MSSESKSPKPGPRVRPVTWVILAWTLIMVAAIVGAWKGSESRYGAIPEISVATENGHIEVLPFSATDLDGNSYTNPVSEFGLREEHLLTVRLPTELRASALDVYEVRERGTREYTVEPDGPGELLIPTVTDEEGRIEGLAVRAVAVVFSADGSESILNGEWSVGFTYKD